MTPEEMAALDRQREAARVAVFYALPKRTLAAIDSNATADPVAAFLDDGLEMAVIFQRAGANYYLAILKDGDVRPVTPIVTVEDMRAVVDGCLLGHPLVTTWQHAHRVLAMAAVLGIQPDQVVYDGPPPLAPAPAAAEADAAAVV